jgi:hypothetical protein
MAETASEKQRRHARDVEIFHSRAKQAQDALAAYLQPPRNNDLDAALRNFLVDYLHLATKLGNGARTGDALKVLVDQAAELYSGELQTGTGHWWGDRPFGG